jgi:hypothetical protein
MGHFQIGWKRNKQNHKTIQGQVNKNDIKKAENNTKHNKITPTTRQVQQKWHI